MSIPALTSLPLHTYPMPNTAYILSGQLTLEETSTVHHHASQPVPIWIGTEDESAKGSISKLIDDAGWHLEKGKSPSSDALCIITPLGEDAANCILRLGLDPKRCIAVDTFGDLNKHRTVMTNPSTLIKYKDAALTLFSHDGTSVSAISDPASFTRALIGRSESAGWRHRSSGLASSARMVVE